MKTPFDLTGKKILVAGVSDMIGHATCRQLSLMGASLFIIDSQPVVLQDVFGSFGATNVECKFFDIYDSHIMDRELKEIIKSTGPFNGFVFTAGKGGVKPLPFTKQEFLKEMMYYNTFTFIEMVRILSKKNAFSKGGSMVALSSVSSIRGIKAKTAYCASKAALDASIRAMALELADKKIRINSIIKGWVSSDMEKDFIQSSIHLSENSDFNKQVLGVIEPDELANTAAFLLSDATTSITGTSIVLDGGYSI